MTKLTRLIALCVPLALGAPAAMATVLTFDNLTGTGSVPTSYGGLTFTNWLYSDVPDPAYLPQSGATNIFTGDFGSSVTDGNATITSATAFTFDGAYFSGYSSVSFKLYDAGVLVAVSSALPSSVTGYGPTFLSSGYSGLVDKVVVSGVQGYFAMDNFTFQAAAVPEPETAALWLAGVAGVAFVVRRKRA